MSDGLPGPLGKRWGFAARAAAYVAQTEGTPRALTCPRCAIIVGQADGDGLLLMEDHEAPCGLPCRERVEFHEVHDRNASCPRCRWTECPVCKGSRITGYRRSRIAGMDRDTVDAMIADPRLSQDARAELYYERDLIFSRAGRGCSLPVSCTRCGGVGKIKGLMLTEDERSW